MFPLFLIVEHAHSFQSFDSLATIPTELKIYTAFRMTIFLLAAIAFSRLLELYEKGIIFAVKNVSQIRRLGTLAIFYGVLTACRPIFEKHEIEFQTLPLNILLSPWVIMGCFIIIIAWIMDEGRKIQEEQELTV